MIYLDWSGDAGFKFNLSSSRYLTVAINHVAQPDALSLSPLRGKLNVGQDFCFHFTSASRVMKPIFFDFLKSLPFSGVVLRVDKAQLPHRFHKLRGDKVIAHFVAEALARFAPLQLHQETLWIDGSRRETALANVVRVAISTRLREVELPPLRRVEFRPACEADGLQIADMLAGAASSQRLGDNALLGELSNKIMLVDG